VERRFACRVIRSVDDSFRYGREFYAKRLTAGSAFFDLEAIVKKRTACRDAGLATAIEAAGGVGRLARMLGLSQPTVSIWKRVPPHRVIEVERLTGLSRRVLRPDLFDVPEPVFSAGGNAESGRISGAPGNR
jgi:DNA-binding transcriptional regulator YdaS (Cro superfamily)